MSSIVTDGAPQQPGDGRSAMRIGLTKAASEFGSALATAIASAGDEVVGLDAESGAGGEVEWRAVDIGSATVVSALDDLDVLVHLAWEPDLTSALDEQPATRRVRQLGQIRTLTTAAAAAGVRRLVVVTSAMVYGARADNPVPVPEDSSLRAEDAEGLVADLVAVEGELATVAGLHHNLSVTIVRPAALVGAGVDTMITRHFEAPRLLTLRGTRPAWTFCHVEDLASALVLLARHDGPDQVTVSSPGTLTQTEVEKLAGMRHVELSESAAYSAADRLHRLNVIPVPASDLAFVAHPWATESARLTDLGWVARHTNEECLQVLLDGVRGHHAVMSRRLRSRDAVGAAAAGAASAAVAVIATAALMRRRRGRD